MALTPLSPILLSAVVSEQRCQSSCCTDRRGGVQSWERELLRVSLSRVSSFSAWLNAQVSSGFLRGSRAEAMALAPSAPMLLPAVVSGQCCQSSCADRRGDASRRGKGAAAGLTGQPQLHQRLVECPGAIRVLAGLQGSGDGPGSLSSNSVPCSSARAALPVIMMRRPKGRSDYSREKAAAGLTWQIQYVQRLVERPGAIRVLAGLQGRGDGLGSLISNPVHCSSSVGAALSVIMMRWQTGRSEQ